jgi:hypothetical protein
MLSFIHIGKTGGTTLLHVLHQKKIEIKHYHYIDIAYKTNEKFIIWIRNPISRFVSAFNMSKSLVHFNCNIPIHKITLNNCTNPQRIIKKIRNKSKYAFNRKYDRLIKFFRNANNLAESLTSADLERKRKAHTLMNMSDGHIFKGIGWYLNNGSFIENRKDDILFVGKTETMSEDINKLSVILKKPLQKNLRIRKNNFSPKESKYLSPLAIENLIEFYKTTDYAALIELNKHGWITDEVLALYYTYP